MAMSLVVNLVHLAQISALAAKARDDAAVASSAAEITASSAPLLAVLARIEAQRTQLAARVDAVAQTQQQSRGCTML